jgi:hypothetical protein
MTNVASFEENGFFSFVGFKIKKLLRREAKDNYMYSFFRKEVHHPTKDLLPAAVLFVLVAV